MAKASKAKVSNALSMAGAVPRTAVAVRRTALPYLQLVVVGRHGAVHLEQASQVSEQPPPPQRRRIGGGGGTDGLLGEARKPQRDARARSFSVQMRCGFKCT